MNEHTHTSNQIQVRWIFLTAGKSGAASDSCESSNKKQNTSTNIILDQPCTLQTQGPTDLLQPRYFENKPCFCACSWKNRCTSDRSERGHANADGWQPHFLCACSFSWNFCLFWLPTVWNILVTTCCFCLTRVFLASYWQNPSSKRFPNVFNIVLGTFVIRMPCSKKLLPASPCEIFTNTDTGGNPFAAMSKYISDSQCSHRGGRRQREQWGALVFSKIIISEIKAEPRIPTISARLRKNPASSFVWTTIAITDMAKFTAPF